MAIDTLEKILYVELRDTVEKQQIEAEWLNIGKKQEDYHNKHNLYFEIIFREDVPMVSFRLIMRISEGLLPGPGANDEFQRRRANTFA